MSSSFQISGIASGLDTKTMIEQLLTIERQPLTRYTARQSQNEKKLSAMQDVNTQLLSLKSSLKTLMEADTYTATSATTSKSSIASITSSSGAATGNYKLTRVSQLATATVMRSSSANPGGGLGGSLGADKDLALSDAGFGITPTNGGNGSGQFTINGTTIEYDVETDSLQDIIDKINSSDAEVAASYDAGTDKVTLTRTGGTLTDPISIGSGADKGNLLKVLHLNDATQGGAPTSLSSSVHLKTVKADEYITSEKSNFGVSVTEGSFTINGVTLNIDSTDTLNTVINKINNSSAGVTASYDKTTDKLLMTSKNTGAQSITMGSSSDTSNFLSAAFIGNGVAETETGKNAIFEMEGFNGGAPITRMSNTIDDLIDGVTITLNHTHNIGDEEEDPVLMTVNQSTSDLTKAINDFVSKFNTVVSNIKLKSSPAEFEDGKKVGEAGPLNGDSVFTGIRSNLQIQITSMVSGVDSTYNSLSSIGVTLNSSGELQVDSSKLSSALNDDINAVEELFTNSTNGIFNALDDYLEGLTNSTSGSIQRSMDGLTSANKLLDTQIASFERRLISMEERLTRQFAEVELAYQNMQSQSSYITNQLSTIASYSY